jgi:hypothetical protein
MKESPLNPLVTVTATFTPILILQMVEGKMTEQEKGCQRQPVGDHYKFVSARTGGHYEFVSPDGTANIAATSNYAEGNEDEWNTEGGETASAGGGCDEREKQNLDSGDGEEEEAGSGHNIVRGWGPGGYTVEETVTLQEKVWKRRRRKRQNYYDYLSPDDKTLRNLAESVKYDQGKEGVDRKGDGEEEASAGGCFDL